MLKLSPTIAFCCLITALFTGCSNNEQEHNNELQEDKEIASNTVRDSLMDSPENVDADFVLLPGIAAGKVKIDESTTEVFEGLGKPDSSDAAMQKMVAFWFDEKNGTRHSTAIFAARNTEDQSPAKVQQIRVTSPAFKTKEGHGVNSTLTDIKKAYDVEEIRFPLTPKQAIYMWIDKEGIAFEIGEDQRCIAVIIYQKGNDPSSTYLPLR